VFARKFSPQTGFYTDLVIFQGRKARIAIEIKWRKKEITEKDRRALASARKNLGVKKTYFYCVIPDGSYRKVPQKRKAEKFRLFERVVGLDYETKQQIEAFEQRRQDSRV